jgi:riboflavin kinase/FMN adenylyltransferase
MKIAYSITDIPEINTPIALTIGNFDGVHLGHQAVLQHLAATSEKYQASSVVLTFSNHPSEVLRPAHPTPLLCTIEHKILLLKQAGVDLVILLPFTKEFSEQSADTFLRKIRESLPFQTLILGSDAHIGKNREGDRNTVTTLAEALGFTVEYFPDIKKEGQRISSSLIRENIQKGHLKQVEDLLGRPYSIYSKVLKGSGRGAPLGFPTANLNVRDLCLPPFGVYAVSLWNEGREFPGVANLGLAPTIRQDDTPILEVHLFDQNIDLYDQFVDVRFYDFIREEKYFDRIEDLRTQIALDVQKAKEIHRNKNKL